MLILRNLCLGLCHSPPYIWIWDKVVTTPLRLAMSSMILVHFVPFLPSIPSPRWSQLILSHILYPLVVGDIWWGNPGLWFYSLGNPVYHDHGLHLLFDWESFFFDIFWVEWPKIKHLLFSSHLSSQLFFLSYLSLKLPFLKCLCNVSIEHSVA